NVSQVLAQHLRGVYNGGNWTAVNLKDTLEGISWQQATANMYHLNTIAALVYHINYYVDAILKVLQGSTLDASDKFSFDLKPVTSEEDWQKLISYVFLQADALATQIEKLEEQKLFAVFADEKYGSYYRNISGLIEHTHYHLGQITLIKKILANQ
ncbi:MAG TPA: hypothetical protein VM101_13180, partial [Flavitalea sp.]|nr:hypothetical protein [Flavitalea sp.]